MQTRNSSHATIVARSARGATMNSQVCSTCVPDIMRMVTVFNHKLALTSKCRRILYMYKWLRPGPHKGENNEKPSKHIFDGFSFTQGFALRY